MWRSINFLTPRKALDDIHFTNILTDSTIKKQVVVWLIASTSLIFLLNVFTIRLFPLVWQDEVMFTEPAANFARHGYLFSRAWFFDRDTDVWAGNAPLYTILLAPWMKIFGFTPESARSFGLLLGSLGIAAWSAAMIRVGVLRSIAALVMLLSALFFDYGVALNLRSGRYDGLGILVFGLMALTLTAPRSRAKLLALVTLGALVVPSGLHLVIPLVVGSFSAVVVSGRRWLSSVIAVGVGCFIGCSIFALALWNLGALEHFMYSANKLSKFSGGGIPKDPSLLLIGIAAILNLCSAIRLKERNEVIYVFAIYVILSACALLALKRFPTYYSWIIVLPLVPMALFEIERRAKPIQVCVRLLILGSTALGLPLQVGAAMSGEGRDFNDVNRFVAKYVHTNDVALVSPVGWYATWPVAAKTYTTEYDAEHKFMTVAEKESISVLVIENNLFPLWRSQLGGNWRKVGDLSDPPKKIPFVSERFGSKLLWRYDIAVYRRGT